MEVIVRADFYPNGDIYPLSITDETGESSFITRVVNIKKSYGKNGMPVFEFTCEAAGKMLSMSYQNGIWIVAWK